MPRISLRQFTNLELSLIMDEFYDKYVMSKSLSQYGTAMTDTYKSIYDKAKMIQLRSPNDDSV